MKTVSPNQISLFDAGFLTAPQKIQQSKNETLEAVRKRASLDYKAKFYAFVEKLQSGTIFDSSLVTDSIGEPQSGGTTGALMNALATLGKIEYLRHEASVRAKRKGAKTSVWKRK